MSTLDYTPTVRSAKKIYNGVMIVPRTRLRTAAPTASTDRQCKNATVCDAEVQFESSPLQHGADPRRAELGMAMAALGRGQNERAWNVLRVLAEEYPEDGEVLHWLLRAACVREAFADAIAPVERYLEAHPEDSSMRFALAGLLIRLGHVNEAATEHARIRATDPGFNGLDELTTALAQAGAPA